MSIRPYPFKEYASLRCRWNRRLRVFGLIRIFMNQHSRIRWLSYRVKNKNRAKNENWYPGKWDFTRISISGNWLIFFRPDRGILLSLEITHGNPG